MSRTEGQYRGLQPGIGVLVVRVSGGRGLSLGPAMDGHRSGDGSGALATVVLPIGHYDSLRPCLGAISQLPVELWGLAVLRSIICLAGELVAVDDYTTEWRQVGFAQICMWIDLSQLLHPRMLINGPEGNQWQRFIYENLGDMCFL